MVHIPADRTLRQPAVAICRNPACREDSRREFEFEVKHDNFACPKCGADREPMVYLRVLTHCLIPSLAGPIRGTGGLRYVIACDVKRAYLATSTNLEAVTDQMQVVNCPGCLQRLAEHEPRQQQILTMEE